MNNKHIILILGLMAASSFAQEAPVFTLREEQNRIEVLQSLSKSSLLNSAQYAEYGLNQKAFIDRDIAVMQKHSENTLARRKRAEGFFFSRFIPDTYKSIALIHGIASLITTAISASGFLTAHSILTGSEAQQCINRAGMGSFEFAIKKFEALSRQKNQNGFFLRNDFPLVVGMGIGSIILIIEAKVFWGKASSYKAENGAFIQEMRNEWDNSQAVIAKLKEIKQEVTYIAA